MSPVAQDLAAECAVLGGVLLEPGCYHRILGVGIVDEDFHSERHRRIWQAFGRLVAAGTPIDILTLSEDLGDDLERVGGFSTLAGLSGAIPSTANVEHYADIVKRKSLVRQLQATAAQIDDDAEQGVALEQILTGLQDTVRQVEARAVRQTARPVSAWWESTMGQVEDARANPGGTPGLATGFVDVDRRVGGLRPEELVIVAARPSMGKTAFMLTAAWHLAQVGPVVCFSLEQSGRALAMRLAALLARVDAEKLRRGGLSQSEYERVGLAISEIAACDNLLIDDASGLPIEEAAARARQLHRDRGILAVFSDYLQIFGCRARFNGNRDREVGYMAQVAKDTAKSLGIPWTMLAQVKRDVETRANKRPQASDLRESGAVEQIADVVLTLYRDEVYDRQTKDVGVGEVWTVKNKEGRIGMDRLAWIAEQTRWANLEDERTPQAPDAWGSWYQSAGGGL